MANELLAAAALLWLAGGILALIRGAAPAAQVALVVGGLAAVAAAVIALPDATATVALPLRMAGEATLFRLTPDALWLMGFGLVPAILACWLGTPAREARGAWCFGAAASLLGALGVFGVQHGGFFLLSWEMMSLGGALMILGERRSMAPGMPVLFMLGLLEVGAVALLVAVLLLAAPAQGLGFAGFVGGAANLPVWLRVLIGVLLVIGFGAKLGLLPFYEWFPGAYGAGSGASGAIMSGVVLNAAFFGLSRGLLGWLPVDRLYGLGIFVVAIGVLSAILAVLYAFQQEDWRTLLSFSSAENAAIAVAVLGAAMLFRDGALPDLAGLAWTVALLQLAAHALAKGALFLTADGVQLATGSYAIGHALIARRSSFVFGAGALFAGDEPRRNAAAGRLRQRVVRVPDRVPGLSSARSGRAADAGAGRRRAGADRGDRLRHLRESARHRAVRRRRENRRRAAGAQLGGGGAARRGGAGARGRHAGLAARARRRRRRAVRQQRAAAHA